MSALDWSHADKGDRSDLKAFSCTQAGRKVQTDQGWQVRHPRMWELKVQSKIRACEPPRGPGRYVLVGRDSRGIAAVSVFEELGGRDVFELDLLAVARRHRGGSGEIALEAAERTVAEILRLVDEVDLRAVRLLTYVHERNIPSQLLCTRVGMQMTGLDADEDLQIWAADLTFIP